MKKWLTVLAAVIAALGAGLATLESGVMDPVGVRQEAPSGSSSK